MLTDGEMLRAKKSADRRGLALEEFGRLSMTEEKLTDKLVFVDFVRAQLQWLAEVIPQIGPARERIEKIIGVFS